jgi:hypothetical protein
MQVTTAIAHFLGAKRQSHNGPDLLDRWSVNLETQLMVNAGRGEPVAGKRNTWSDGVDSWWHIRIPKNADSEPKWHDYEMPSAVIEHVEAIGSTGWDWVNRQSLWAAFDFDSLTGHAAGVGVSPAELDRVKAAAIALPYVEVRRSSGGGGLHLYVLLDSIPTANHTEHAALARAILGMMATDAGFDFASQVDACGGNTWLYHRKADSTNGGFALIKPSEKRLCISDIPANWRDHLDVVSRKRSKIKIAGVDDGFERLSAARKAVPLENAHREFISKLEMSGFSTIWVPDHHLLQTHTAAIAGLELIGPFRTLSNGNDPGTPNCFLFPLKNSAWRCYRFSKGIREHELWNHNQGGWTWCYVNRRPDLATAAKANGGNEDEKHRWVLTLGQMLKTLADLGEKVTLPETVVHDGRAELLAARIAYLKMAKDGRVVASFERLKNEVFEGWIAEKHQWTKLFRIELPDEEQIEADEIFRSLLTLEGESAGFVTRSNFDTWDRHPIGTVKMVLQSRGFSKTEAESLIGQAADDRWQLVSLPFQPEYPGGRRWNRDAAQLSCVPAERDAPHEHWDRILEHTGASLDKPLKDLAWAQEANIRSGADYLRCLFACIIREPFEPTPYLFLHGPENSGKSILWEAFSLLVTRGVVKADRALTNQNDFNGELAGAVLCVIEEKDISKTPGALNKIKDFVTAKTLSIRRMRTDAYSQPNTTHWMQFSNNEDACLILPGDTRITPAYVGPLPPGSEIPKANLLDILKAEAPAFLRTLLDLQLPPLSGRLRLPVVESEEKAIAQESNRDAAEEFVGEHCQTGSKIMLREFYEKFQDWLDPEERLEWTKRRLSKWLKKRFSVKPGTCNITFIFGLDWRIDGNQG